MSANEYLIDASTRHQIMLQRLSGHYKYDAWKAGKISGADFVDGKGAEIDLSYLKSLDSITL